MRHLLIFGQQLCAVYCKVLACDDVKLGGRCYFSFCLAVKLIYHKLSRKRSVRKVYRLRNVLSCVINVRAVESHALRCVYNSVRSVCSCFLYGICDCFVVCRYYRQIGYRSFTAAVGFKRGYRLVCGIVCALVLDSLVCSYNERNICYDFCVAVLFDDVKRAVLSGISLVFGNGLLVCGKSYCYIRVTRCYDETAVRLCLFESVAVLFRQLVHNQSAVGAVKCKLCSACAVRSNICILARSSLRSSHILALGLIVKLETSVLDNIRVCFGVGLALYGLCFLYDL